MKIFKTLAIDDNPADLKDICNYINGSDDLILHGSFLDPILAIPHLPEVDLVFLDVEMKPLTGLEVLKYFPAGVQVVLATAIDGYAVDGFDQNVTDFLLKPYDESRFRKSVEKVKRLDLLLSGAMQGTGHDTIPITVRERNRDVTTLIRKSDILYIQSDENYVKVFTTTRPQFFHVLRKLNTCAEWLDSELFFQVHRQNIVNRLHIKEIRKFERRIQMSDGALLKIGDAFLPDLWSLQQ